MPRVFSDNSVPVNFERSHLPAFMEAVAAAVLRAAASMRHMVCSAAETTLDSGALHTMTPRSVAASRSMLSTPTPARPMTFSFSPASMTSRVTVVALRTIRPS